MKKIVFVAGGSGGHIFPTFAVADAISNDFEKIFFTSRAKLDRGIFKKSGRKFHRIFSGKFRRYFSLKNFTDIFKIFIGVFQSFFLLRKNRPVAIFAKGGFVAVPVAIAARVLQIEIISHESDARLGLANRILQKLGARVLRNFAEKNFPVPVAPGILNSEKVEIFSNQKPIVLILGGSQGAAEINEKIQKIWREIDANFLIQTGRGKNIFAKIDAENLRATEFLSPQKMGQFLRAANLVVSRAGATAIAEIAAFEKPAIFCPLSGHQISNAEFLARKNAAEILRPENFSAENLKKEIEKILRDQSLAKILARNLQKFYDPRAAEKIAGEIFRENTKPGN